MKAFGTLPSGDPEAIADLAAAALEQDPDDWLSAHLAAHLAVEHPQMAGRSTWPDDNPYAAHDNDHRDWIHDHTHDRSHSRREAADTVFNKLNPDFGVLSDGHDPQQHRFAARPRAGAPIGHACRGGAPRPQPSRRSTARARRRRCRTTSRAPRRRLRASDTRGSPPNERAQPEVAGATTASAGTHP
jgi:hypothetical protein